MLKLKGSIKISGDKSISHRALIFASLSTGKVKISNLLESDDVMRTLNILKELGIKIIKKKAQWIVYGNGTGGYIQPAQVLDCGNSGTTSRLMIGAVSSNPISCTFIGDNSLSKRSMSRLSVFLEKMGAEIKLTKKDFLPLHINGDINLIPMEHIMQKASAQVKSALILSALNLRGKTRIIEKKNTRDHTERLMRYLKINFKKKILSKSSTSIELNGPYEIMPRNIIVASDPSSAAFFIVGALIIPDSKITLKNIALNKSRIAFIDVLKKMGGKIRIKKTKNISGEDVGDIHVKYSLLNAIKIKASLSPYLIDEYPILSIAASQAKGITTMRGLSELRHKESDRIKSIVTNLSKVGFKVVSKKDDISIKGSNKIQIDNRKKIKTYSDHRIAMSFVILGLLYKNKLIIDDESCISISYPDFKNHLKKLSSH
ncbi:3-phosphoshikimate 1-carboxyvinyltransferase [Pelagibacteraceae bacterium]|nr:3-phosphoshikimate 1-carboxyvinyltransferase [Pelagibacteraceae bacterium]